MAIRYAKSAKSVEQLWQLISPLFPDLSCSGLLLEIGFSALIYALDIHIHARSYIHMFTFWKHSLLCQEVVVQATGRKSQQMLWKYCFMLSNFLQSKKIVYLFVLSPLQLRLMLWTTAKQWDDWTITNYVLLTVYLLTEGVAVTNRFIVIQTDLHVISYRLIVFLGSLLKLNISLSCC